MKPSAQDITEALQDILSRSLQCFAYYYYRTQIHHSAPTTADFLSLNIASLESSLMSMRDLDSFFASKSGRDDDMAAAHYGFPVGKQFLTPEQRNSINTKLAHLTYISVREKRQLPPVHYPRTWNYADLVKRAMDRVQEFLDHLETTVFANDLNQLQFIGLARTTIAATLKNINNVAQQELDFPA